MMAPPLFFSSGGLRVRHGLLGFALPLTRDEKGWRNSIVQTTPRE